MHDRLRQAFDQIHAEEELKDKTREFLKQNMQRPARPRAVTHALRAVACLAVVLLGFGGYRFYFTPTSVISIDINPSVELGVNRLDKVVSVEGYNDDGDALAQSLNVRFLDYTQAIDEILAPPVITDCLAQDGALSIAVVGENEEQSGRLLTHIQSCTAGQQNVTCYAATQEELDEAHDVGLSYGKYRALLELQKLDPTVTSDDVRNMPMREIRDWLAELSGESEPAGIPGGNGSGNGQGAGNGPGNGQGTGSGQGNGNGQGTGQGNGMGQGGSGNGQGSGYHGGGNGRGKANT
ncbi:MAG: hypothetical protein Q3Y08_01620 [Butyricicoccus sp.]|nr:hypothetical protein [Butyricicoccus sp.]